MLSAAVTPAICRVRKIALTGGRYSGEKGESRWQVHNQAEKKLQRTDGSTRAALDSERIGTGVNYEREGISPCTGQEQDTMHILYAFITINTHRGQYWLRKAITQPSRPDPFRSVSAARGDREQDSMHFCNTGTVYEPRVVGWERSEQTGTTRG